MAGVATALSTPFATVIGQQSKYTDVGMDIGAGPDDPVSTGAALGRKGKMSARLSSLVLDDAFDSMLPLSPSLDNFLNLATTCLHNQNLLPGRLFSTSAGRSLSALGSLDLGWITEGMAMEGVEGCGEGVECKQGAVAGGEAAPGQAHRNSGFAGAAVAVAAAGQGGVRRKDMQGGSAEGCMPMQGPPVLSGGSFLAAATTQPQLPNSPALHLHPRPVTSGAAGLPPLQPPSSAAPAPPPPPLECHCEVQGTNCQSHAGVSPAGQHSAAQQAIVAAQGQGGQQQPHALGLQSQGQQHPPPSPFLQEQLAAAQAYHQQMLSYLQQAGSALGGMDYELSGQYSSGACSTHMTWSGLASQENSSTFPATSMAVAAYLQQHVQQAGAITGTHTPPASPLAPRSPASTGFPGSPLTPESAMAAAQLAQQAQQASDTWAQQMQQMELWCHHQQQAALMQAYGMGGGGGGAEGPGARPTDHCSAAFGTQPLPFFSDTAAGNSSGLMPTPFSPGGQYSKAQQGQQATLPFQLRVSTVPSFRVSTVNPVKLSQTTPTITFAPNK